MDVLVVDDEEDVRVLFEMYLQARGHGVTAVGSAAAAHTALVEGTFDLLCLDLTLPHAEGLELMEQLRAEGVLPPYVVLMSGLRAGVLEGAADHLGVLSLAKPFTVDDLDALLAEVAAD